MSLDTTVLIVDDHEMVRSGLRMVIEGTGRMKVVGEAANGEDALRLARQFEPDVILMDISMPGGIDGIEVTRRITAAGLETNVLILTRHDHVEYLEPIMAAGAMGFMKKSRSPDELVRSIDMIAAGRMTMPREAVELYVQGSRDRNSGPVAQVARLSEKERKILELAARGFTTREIASEMFLADRTVENYRARLKSKLGLKRRSDLVALALKAGLLQGDQQP